MPELFPVMNDAGEIVEVPHYTVDEVMDLFHTSRETVYKRMRDGDWPYIRIVRKVYFSPAHVAEIVARSTHDDGKPGGLARERADARERKARR